MLLTNLSSDWRTIYLHGVTQSAYAPHKTSVAQYQFILDLSVWTVLVVASWKLIELIAWLVILFGTSITSGFRKNCAIRSFYYFFIQFSGKFEILGWRYFNVTVKYHSFQTLPFVVTTSHPTQVARLIPRRKVMRKLLSRWVKCGAW